MQNLYFDVTTLDRRASELFQMPSMLLMEHAAMAIAQFISTHIDTGSTLLFVCGGGDNGADGLAAARLLQARYDVRIFQAVPPKSKLCAMQFERIKKLALPIVERLSEADVVIDALIGSGLTREFNDENTALIMQMNDLQAVKLACDFSSGIRSDGTHNAVVFNADVTISMGALKCAYYADENKAYVGEIEHANLGIARSMYEVPSSWKLLEAHDLDLPYRTQINSHKGSFGHAVIVCGEKEGASVLAALAALRFGAGLVTLLSNERIVTPHEIMHSHTLPTTTTAMALGMGLGQEYSDSELKKLLKHTLPLVVDADLFYSEFIVKLLRRGNLVITPHPKEFVALLKCTNIADIDVQTLQHDRFAYVESFSQAFPEVVLLLKGANVIIASHEQYYINPLGTNVLAKGGSGDVLSGMIVSLLAQGYAPLDAAIAASLAHTQAAANFEGNNYALLPTDLIANIGTLS